MSLVTPHKPSDGAFCKALIHSPAGHGKTRFLGTAEDDERTSPMAFLNFEGGTKTLVGKDIDVFDVTSWSDYEDVYRQLSDPKSKYKSVGIDSITETQVDGLLSILQTDKNRPDPDQLGKQDWGVILVKMRRFVRHYKHLSKHVFFTALSKDDVMPRLGQVKVPAIQGGFQNELPGIMDVVGYLALEEGDKGVERLLLLRDYPRFSVKARTPWDVEVPSEIVNPTVTSLLDALGY